MKLLSLRINTQLDIYIFLIIYEYFIISIANHPISLRNNNINVYQK